MVNGRNRGGRGGHLGRGAVGGGPNPPAKIAGLGAGNAQVNGNQLTLTAGCTVEFADGESARIYMSSGIYRFVLLPNPVTAIHLIVVSAWRRTQCTASPLGRGSSSTRLQPSRVPRTSLSRLER